MTYFLLKLSVGRVSQNGGTALISSSLSFFESDGHRCSCRAVRHIRVPETDCHFLRGSTRVTWVRRGMKARGWLAGHDPREQKDRSPAMLMAGCVNRVIRQSIQLPTSRGAMDQNGFEKSHEFLGNGEQGRPEDPRSSRDTSVLPLSIPEQSGTDYTRSPISTTVTKKGIKRDQKHRTSRIDFYRSSARRRGRSRTWSFVRLTARDDGGDGSLEGPSRAIPRPARTRRQRKFLLDVLERARMMHWDVDTKPRRT